MKAAIFDQMCWYVEVGRHTSHLTNDLLGSFNDKYSSAWSTIFRAKHCPGFSQDRVNFHQNPGRESRKGHSRGG